MKLLDAFIVPDMVEGGAIKSMTLMTENLQAVFHRLALSISKQEHDVVAEFQAEVWGVLGWLSGGGGSVAVLKQQENAGVFNPELGRGRSSCGNGYGSVKSGDITTPSGQITLHGAGEKCDEVVMLTPGQPAILSPVLPRILLPSRPELRIPPIILDGSPMLPAKTKREPGLPFSLESQSPQLSATTNLPPPTSIEEGRDDTIHFFLSDQMEAYLQDSYEKVLRVQTNISLKWRRIRKVFEREWCSGISRFARNGVVARALWNVYGMEETDWLTMDSPTTLLDCRSEIKNGRNINLHHSSSDIGSTTEQGHSERENRGEGVTTEMAKAPERDSMKQILQTPLRAVWDRRGLCQEVEPVSLSNEGPRFLELVEKMCLKRVMEYAEMENVLGEDSVQPISLPPPPESSLFPGSEGITNPECQSSAVDQRLRSIVAMAGCKNSSDQPQDQKGSCDTASTNGQGKTGTRGAVRNVTGSISPTQG